MNIEFKDFPISYRVSQGGIALALVLLTFSGTAFSQNAPQIVKIIAGSILGTIVLIYMMIMFGFLVFLSFVYDPVSHPTIATFIRATLGIGVILFPLFIPAIMLGSLRCNHLLENATDPYAVDDHD